MAVTRPRSACPAHWSRPAWWTATPTWSTAATAAAELSAPAAGPPMSRLPAGGGIRSTVAPRAGQRRNVFAAAARARCPMAEGDDARDQVRLRASPTGRACLAVARRIGRELLVLHHRGAHAAVARVRGPPDDYIDAVCAWLPAQHTWAWSDGGCVLRPHRLQHRADRRVFAAARCLGCPSAACRAARSDQGGRRSPHVTARASCDHLGMAGRPTACARWPRPAPVAVLGAYYFLLRPKLPPLQALRRPVGVPSPATTTRLVAHAVAGC